jgi:hypothetical protein
VKTYRLQETGGSGWPLDVPVRVVTTVPGIEDMVCPTCEGSVHGEPPAGGGAEWSHPDGTPLWADSEAA